MHAERRDVASLADLADLVGGDVSGDPSTVISGVAPLDTAGPGQISFLTNPRYQSQLVGCRAAAIIVHPSLQGTVEIPLLLSANPYLAFAKILTFFVSPPHVGLGVQDGAHVHPEAMVAENVTISPGCVISAGVKVGKGTFLHPNVVIGNDAIIGEDCLLHHLLQFGKPAHHHSAACNDDRSGVAISRPSTSTAMERARSTSGTSSASGGMLSSRSIIAETGPNRRSASA